MRYAWAAVMLAALLAVSTGLGGGYLIFRLQSTESQLEEAQSLGKKLEKEIEAQQEREKKLIAEKDSIEEKIVALVNKVGAINSSLGSTARENQELKFQITVLSMQLREVAAGLGVQIEELRSSAKVRDAQLTNATRQVEELKKEIANLTKQILDLKRDLEASRDRRVVNDACAPGSIVFQEGFEYADSIANHGWITSNVAGPASTQTAIVAEGTRALKLNDDSTGAATSYIRSLPRLATNFQIDYYLRAERYEQVVGLNLAGDLINIPRIGGVRTHVRTELSDANRSFYVQDTPFFTYELNRWYHIKLVVRPSMQNLDVYVDNMEVPLARNIQFSDASFNILSIGTATAGIGSGYWDGITIRCLP